MSTYNGNDFIEQLRKENAELKDKCTRYEKREGRLGIRYKNHEETGDVRDIINGYTPAVRRVRERDIYGENSASNTPCHIFLEGDNFSSLSTLCYTHAHSVDLIYIDPPYNTGKEFKYNDSYVSDEDGFKHSKWLSFMKPRLMMARQLLSDTGVILVSIGHQESDYLGVLLREIFGDNNYISTMIWDGSLKNNGRFISNGHDFLYVFAKNKRALINADVKWREKKPGIDMFLEFIDELNQEEGTDADKQKKLRAWLKENKAKIAPGLKNYNRFEGGSTFTIDNLSAPGGNGAHYDVIHPVTGKPVKTPSGGWRYSEEKMNQLIADNMIVFGKDETTVPQFKRVLGNDNEQGNLEQIPRSYFWDERSNANKMLGDIIGKSGFDYPKSHTVLERLIDIMTCSKKDAIILDFFAGTGSTAHAVMELNHRDGGHRQCIIATNNENDIAHKIAHTRMSNLITGQWHKKRDGIYAYDTEKFAYYEVKPADMSSVENPDMGDNYCGVAALVNNAHDVVEDTPTYTILSGDNTLVGVYKNHKNVVLSDVDYEKFFIRLHDMSKDSHAELSIYVPSDYEETYGDEIVYPSAYVKSVRRCISGCIYNDIPGSATTNHN